MFKLSFAVITCITLLTSISAMANCQSSHVLNQGESISSDVLGQNPYVVYISTSDKEKLSTPSVKTKAQYVGFECWPSAISLVEKTDETQCWKVELTWSPGADTSGCEIDINHRSWNKKAHVNLYMNY